MQIVLVISLEPVAKLQKYNLYFNEKLVRNFYKFKIISQFVIKLRHNFKKNEIQKQ